MAAAVQHPDPALVEALGRQVGAQPMPSLGLAALTARGDSGARREVLGALDDERVWVRDWMLDGIEEPLDAEIVGIVDAHDGTVTTADETRWRPVVVTAFRRARAA